MQAFYENWTATHEFSHLMLPYLQSEQRWVSEGFAQYYQNVLLARAGRYTQRYTWQKLFDGLERGRESVPGLSPNDAASGDERNSRMKVYWSGAALALLADVELRRRSNGEQTLDAVLGKFQECCLPSQRTWTGMELFTKFDSLLDEPLFMNLYREHADTVGFPAVESLLRELGVTRIGDQIRLSNAAKLAQIRIAMTGRDASIPEYDRPPRDH
jgi:predicted metalloprotease with PDZ domain